MVNKVGDHIVPLIKYLPCNSYPRFYKDVLSVLGLATLGYERIYFSWVEAMID